MRLSIRANASQKELLKRVALARNTDLSQFVIEAPFGEAKRLISQESTVVLSPADYEQLCRAMDDHPQICAPYQSRIVVPVGAFSTGKWVRALRLLLSA